MGRKPMIRKSVVEDAPNTEFDGAAVRDEEKISPIAGLENEVRKRAPGNWQKISQEDLVNLERSGRLVGYDPSTGEAIIKEE